MLQLPIGGAFEAEFKRLLRLLIQVIGSLLKLAVALTFSGEELGVDHFEGVLANDARGTFRLKAAIKSLYFRLRKPGHAAQGRHRVGTVARGQFVLLAFRFWKRSVKKFVLPYTSE